MDGFIFMIVSIRTFTGRNSSRKAKSTIFSFRYDYIALLDYDDMIVPKIHNNWSEMMKQIEKVHGKRASYHFKNFYYFDDMLSPHGFDPNIPEYLHMMQHVYRSSGTTGLADNG